MTVFESGARILAREDDDVVAVAERILRDEGVTILHEARITRVADVGAGGADLTYESGAIAVDEHLRTSRPHIYALGDVNGGPQFTYISLDDSRIVRDQLVGDGRRSTADRVAVPRTVFMNPPFATVGLTEKQTVAAGRRLRIASQPVAEIINTVALAMRNGITASALRDGIYTHPSSTEALNDVLGADVDPQDDGMSR